MGSVTILQVSKVQLLVEGKDVPGICIGKINSGESGFPLGFPVDKYHRKIWGRNDIARTRTTVCRCQPP